MKAYYSFDLFNSDCVHIYAIYFIKIHNTERVNTWTLNKLGNHLMELQDYKD
jgi:hypothetical protein